MSERIHLCGDPEEAARQLWAHLCEKTMLDGEKLQTFDSPEDAAVYFLPQMSREALEKINAGEMPPEDEPRPSEKEISMFITQLDANVSGG